MSHRFVRCPHCKIPHDATVRVCPTTGLALTGETRAPAPVRGRMSEVPPPSRPPEPLARPRPRRDDPSATGGRGHEHELVGHTLGGRYHVHGVLGEGGMGTVYDAEHVGLGRPVAIKVLSPTQAKKRVAVKRFQQEARAASATGHPNICEVYDLGHLDDGSPYLVMEKLVGQTLAERIAHGGGLPFSEVADILVQVLAGLGAAHDKGIVHRDIKPENIFLVQRQDMPMVAKILDFGVSKMVSAMGTGDADLELTRTGMVMGTPYYMSPEQARGQRDLDGRVDVYACGVMMYEAIAGRRPFLAPNYNALLLAIINTVPRSLRELRPSTPPALEAIVGRAMAKNRDDRYGSARELQADLHAFTHARASVPPPPTAEERARAQILGGSPASGVPRSRRGMQADESTRVDVPTPRRVEQAVESRASRPFPSGEQAARRSGSVEIPIEVEDFEDPPALPGADFGAEYDELPTEVFRPGVHRPPIAAPRTDDWENETVVKPFNPDETVIERKELDFPDETELIRRPPPRR